MHSFVSCMIMAVPFGIIIFFGVFGFLTLKNPF